MARLKIKSVRQQKGLTQKELAQKLGVSQNFLSELENNKYDIKLSMFYKLLDVLEIYPCDIIEPEDLKCKYFKFTEEL